MHSGAAAAVHSKPHSNGTSHMDPPTRHSPPPLAPLQFLQSQRRGSITDPSLHAASSMKGHVNYQYPDFSSKHLPFPRPTSPFVFGDATPHMADNSPRIQNLLRSPSPDRPTVRPSSLEAGPSSQAKGTLKPGEISPRSRSNPSQLGQDRRVPSREPLPFDYNMRRHSIAATQEHFHPTIGTKRKMSTDRGGFSTVNEETDPQLVGPGVPSPMEVDPDVPAPKRRGSAIDTQKIAQLSLNDRRNSVDARAALGQWPGWSSQARRGSTPNLLPSIPPVQSGFNLPPPATENANTAQSRLPPGIATFTWPPNNTSTPESSSSNPSDGDAGSSSQRPADQVPPLNPTPPLNYISNRRMSVPDILSSAPSKGLPSRSRPPSRTTPNGELGQAPDSPLHEMDESDTGPANVGYSRDKGNTPYSRSPELRVSHKLAERKRRKEMKDLFDELRDQLPADRGMKASKWEILSKAIDFVSHLKQSHDEMARDLDLARQELDAVRKGIPFQPNEAQASQASVSFMQPAPNLTGPQPFPGSGTMSPNQVPPLSRSQSSEDASPSQNGGSIRTDSSPI